MQNRNIHIFQFFKELAGIDSDDLSINENSMSYYSKSFPMKSIKPIYSEEEILMLDSIYQGIDEFVMMFKADGYACEVVYKNGSLTGARLRGRTTVGADVTRHIKNIMPDYIEGLKDYPDVSIRVELIITSENFEELRNRYPGKPFKTQRNSVASLVAPSAIDEDIKLLGYLSHTILGVGAKTKSEELTFLANLGLEVVPFVIVKREDAASKGLTLGELILSYTQALSDLSEKLTYETDGVVFQVNDNDKFLSLGEDEKYREGNKALKVFRWGNQVYESEILGYEWSYGTNTITPVAIIKPVLTRQGRLVSRVNLNNIETIQSYGLTVGAPIIFEYVSDMNPHLIR